MLGRLKSAIPKRAILQAQGEYVMRVRVASCHGALRLHPSFFTSNSVDCHDCFLCSLRVYNYIRKPLKCHTSYLQVLIFPVCAGFPVLYQMPCIYRMPCVLLLLVLPTWPPALKLNTAHARPATMPLPSPHSTQTSSPKLAPCYVSRRVRCQHHASWFRLPSLECGRCDVPF